MAAELAQDGSLIRTSLLRRRPETGARGELVWNEDVASPEPTVAEPPAAPTVEEVVVAPTGGQAQEALASEIARRRSTELERLDAELGARRAELARTLERQRAEAEERIAAAERLEREAMARRREEVDRLWSAEQPRMFAERIDSALAAELVGAKQRYEQAEVRVREEIETRRGEEAARLEAWRASERERIEAELASEERRFNERLMRQLKEFEFQLGERMREQEERLARWWDEAEKLARQRVATLLQETLDPKA